MGKYTLLRSAVTIISLILAFSNGYASSTGPVISFKFTHESFASNAPTDLSELLYSLILAQNYSSNEASYDPIIKLFFTHKLYMKYINFSAKKNLLADEDTQGECIDWDLMINAQDIPSGFSIGAPITVKNTIQVPVIFYPNTTSSLSLIFIKETNGYKIQDIYYPDQKQSMIELLDGCTKT